MDNAGDVVTELLNGGTDTVYSSVSFVLPDNVENLILIGSANINGGGNTLNNILTGNAGSNSLTGSSGNDTLDGGAGVDTMAGGLGNDTYIVDDAADLVVELAGEGTDTVQSSANYTLGDNVENLTLTGTANINGSGNALDNVITGNSGTCILAGGVGNDTYVVSSPGSTLVENISEGIDTVQSGITFTLGDNIENLTLTGAAAINGTGNTLDNVITGNAGANVIDGGAGADSMSGGGGNDTYYVDNAGDVVTELLSGGTDTVISSVTYTIGANVENLILTGSAGITGTGNTLDNVITGNNGAGILAGGLGNDTYVVSDAANVIVENAGEGTDTVQSSVSYTLGANVENLTLTGTANINGTGNDLDNAIAGNSGTNILAGGLGNDTYYVDGTSDVVVEGANAGIDTVKSSATYTLGANIENLVLVGFINIDGTGNALDNSITGNMVNNVIDGGAGADTMAGGTGNDTYYVDNAGDVVTELLNGGTDTVISSVSFVLPDNVENLVLTGTANIFGTGNALNNILTGNAGNNSLTGSSGNDTLDGGAGADTLVGGAGNDNYIVDNAGDVVVENLNEGTDTVNAYIDYVLGANVENLTLLGTADINGWGNALANTITGNSGANLLSGEDGNDSLQGNAANDVLQGGNGDDTLADTGGNNLFNGGAGNDIFTGSSGNELFIGGAGNDTTSTGTGADIIAFNAGGGQDNIAQLYGVGDNTISLGGGILYQNLTFSKSATNLIFGTGGGDQITIQNWYGNSLGYYRSVSTLQVVLDAAAYNPASGDPLLDQRVQTFNFTALATSFDQALAANPALTSWNLTNALLSAHLAGSDTAALGGDLAYQYAVNGTLAGIGLVPAQAELASPSFGTAAQTLQPLANLQTGAVRLG